MYYKGGQGNKNNDIRVGAVLFMAALENLGEYAPKNGSPFVI